MISCKGCGKELDSNKSKYCSKECQYTQYKKRLRESKIRTCKRCGKSIPAPEAGKRALLYCSDYCHTGEDGKYRVYILENENYAGMTAKLWSRMTAHEYNGKDVSDMVIVGVFDNPIEAHLLETQLHLDGYDGFYVERSHFE